MSKAELRANLTSAGINIKYHLVKPGLIAAKTLNIFNDYIQRLPVNVRQGKGLILHGQPNTGKSFALAYLFKRFFKWNKAQTPKYNIVSSENRTVELPNGTKVETTVILKQTVSLPFKINMTCLTYSQLLNRLKVGQIDGLDKYNLIAIDDFLLEPVGGLSTTVEDFFKSMASRQIAPILVTTARPDQFGHWEFEYPEGGYLSSALRWLNKNTSFAEFKDVFK